MTGICKGAHASAEHLEIAKALFDAVWPHGRCGRKKHGRGHRLSASGPAFAYIILESLPKPASRLALPRDVATLLAAQTIKALQASSSNRGSSRVTQGFRHHTAGCTHRRIMEPRKGNPRHLIKAV